MAVLHKKQRNQDARQKFLLGLMFEQAGLCQSQQDYLESDQAFKMAQKIHAQIENQPGLEHVFYQAGQTAFASKAFMENNDKLEKAKQNLGENWKSQRYHNLVRLGGDLMRSELGQYPKATILGALLSHQATLKKTTQ